ncbi:hypothetical protein RFI_30741, partial [Reticulomyxa filosa]
HISLHYALQNSQYYHDANGVNDKESYLLKPHAAQVIAIFCMLGIDEGKPGLINNFIGTGESKTALINNFVQIGTGEGKSIILAVTACALALFGFDVSCASYSEYLSCRDLKSFEPLFNAFGVTDHIHYGTFNQLCERLINDEGDVRKLVEHLLLSGEDRKEEQTFFNETARTTCAKILLIDEVDIFFSKEFYGSFYSPAATLRHDIITQLIDFIWSNREPRLTLNKVRGSPVYRACCNILKGWDSLLDEAIKDMLRDVYTFASHSYQVSNDKIGYKDQDSISYNVRYGYKTLFAYYHEHEQAKISDESFKQNVFISFQIGNFSYAEVPKNKIEKNVVKEDYHVSKYTYIPSLFGEHKLAFAEKNDIIIEDESIYFNALKTEIDYKLVGRTEGTKRAVLVFFDSIKSLKEFYESVNFAPMKSAAIVMTEENSFAEKESLIKRATTSGQIGLFTKSFGRGTDFASFLSEELSEETQIKGRTARQGGCGSYSLVLCEKALERFLITKNDIEKARKEGSFYPLLNSSRNRFFSTQYEDSKKYVADAAIQHKASEALIKAVKDSDIITVKEMLCEQNRGTDEKKCVRTMVLMDATGSMSHLLRKSKHAVSTMFERINPFWRKITLPTTLKCNLFFMEKVQPRYGDGNEAIEVVLAYVNRELKTYDVSQVILIGDAPPNTQREVEEKRRNSRHGTNSETSIWPYNGENYWKNTKLFSRLTYFKDELRQLRDFNIPVHAFFICERAEQSFRKIACATNGRCEKLDINSEKGSDQLTNLVSEEVLRNIGGSKGDTLVDAYKKKFSKSYTAQIPFF